MGPLGVFALLYLLFEKERNKEDSEGGYPLKPQFLLSFGAKERSKESIHPI